MKDNMLTASRLELASKCPGAFAHQSVETTNDATERGTQVHEYIAALLEEEECPQPADAEAAALCKSLDRHELMDAARPNVHSTIYTEQGLYLSPASSDLRNAGLLEGKYHRDYSGAPEGALPGTADGGGTNLLLAPATLPVLGPVFVAMLALNMPLLTRMEERLFRGGTRSYLGAVPRSLVFGLARCAVGVPLAAGLALAIPGMWFSRQYLQGEAERPGDHSRERQRPGFPPRLPIIRGVLRKVDREEGEGLTRAVLHHTCYNVLLLMVAASLMVLAFLT